MNYFEFYISDYQRKTAHLSLSEHGAYNLMMQIFYASERELPLEKKVLYKLLRADTVSEKRAVDSVLEQFWEQGSMGYFNRRAQQVLDEYRTWVEKQRANGKRRGKPNDSDRSANGQPSLSDGTAKGGDSTSDLDLRPPTKPPTLKPAEASLGTAAEGVGERKRFRTWQEIQAEEDARNGVHHAVE